MIGPLCTRKRLQENLLTGEFAGALSSMDAKIRRKLKLSIAPTDASCQISEHRAIRVLRWSCSLFDFLAKQRKQIRMQNLAAEN
jgi:hypothetical protein